MSPSLAIDDPLLEAFASEVGLDGPVAVSGGRTRWSIGGELAAGTKTVSAPSGVVDYRPDEMTVRVRCGTTVAELHEQLRAAGQRTSLPERGGTVGGAIAVGENGPFVLGRGLLRAALLQVRYVSAEGRLVTGGGPTVKNVSGFDIPRIMVGSLGTLGLMAEVILRTNPIPPVQRVLAARNVDPAAVLDAVLRPGTIVFDGTTTTVQLEGHGADVDAEAKRLAEMGAFEEVAALPELPPHRWSFAPAELRSLDGNALGRHVALIGVGTVYAANEAPQRAVDPTVRLISDRLKAAFDPTGRINPGRSVLPMLTTRTAS